MSIKQKNAKNIALLAGILLLISGVSGAATWQAIRDFVTHIFYQNIILEIIFVILIFIASLGGISVIIGGLLIGKNKARTGKFFIMLGAGMGLIGLFVSILVALVQQSFTIASFFSVGTLGILLSILARIITK
ncbi:MAG: hypothetical protein R6V50_00015 [Thermoplasmatota archaeon]